jgi:uncharacterized protein
MARLQTRMLAAVAALALALPGTACANAPVPAAAAPVAASPGPALWKVADADTTIYLFGTVHILPKDVEWYRGALASALAESQVLVTEIQPSVLKQPATQQLFLARATLPEGQTLRSMLSAEQRSTYEAALAKLGVPAEPFDRFEPWFAAITLATIPILKAGYTLEAGVENAIDGKLAAAVRRDALETVEGQLKLFDEMPSATQVEYLMSVAEQVDRVVPSMNAMVTAWSQGDAERLAALMNEELDDPALAERLLYARNRNWAEWVENRLAQPGTVFVAVGAGHLAGANSVQDYLGKEGVKVTRVQ